MQETMLSNSQPGPHTTVKQHFTIDICLGHQSSGSQWNGTLRQDLPSQRLDCRMCCCSPPANLWGQGKTRIDIGPYMYISINTSDIIDRIMPINKWVAFKAHCRI
eukprot:10638418-Karenia_brevis.AAC.1